MTLRRLWLIFAQWVTISVAVLFVVQTLRPDWFSLRPTAPTPTPVVVSQAPPTPQAAAPGPVPASYSGAAARAMPAVVNVFTAREMRTHPFIDDPLFRRFFGDQFGGSRRATSLGSGVIVSDRGFVLTNNHVIESAEEIQIALADGRSLKARVIGTDPETDIAVVKVESAELLPAITFGDDTALRVGDVVLAIGNPFGVGQTVTMGIVSALGRKGLDINTFENFIQTDAAINQGNSGGALVDANGNLVGVNTAILSGSGGSVGIGFAIPTSIAKAVMAELIETGAVTRGFIGVQAQSITPEHVESFGLPNDKGALIAGVQPGGPAERAGVKAGDVLIAVGGKAVGDTNDMLNIVAALKPGMKVPLRLRREGRELEVTVEIARRPATGPRR